MRQYNQRRRILKLVKSLLKAGWSQILIKDGDVYASGGDCELTSDALKNAPTLINKS
jgi:hypothetical protein